MTPAEYRRTIAALGLTQVGAAKLLGVDPRTSRHRIAGSRRIDEPAARFLQYILAARIRPADVLRLLASTEAPQAD
jgi:hypothetical protein